MARLANIIRLRKWELDEKRRELAALLGERDQIVSTIDTINAEITAQSKKQDLEVGAVTIGAYIEGARVRQAELAELLRTVEAKVGVMQEKVANSFRELKTFEIAHKRELDRKMATEAKLEQDAFDELGIQSHAREEAITDPSYIKMRR